MKNTQELKMEKFLRKGLNEIANMSIKRLKALIRRLKKSGTQASLEGIKIIKEIIKRKKQESTIMGRRLHGENTYGMGRQDISMHG